MSLWRTVIWHPPTPARSRERAARGAPTRRRRRRRAATRLFARTATRRRREEGWRRVRREQSEWRGRGRRAAGLIPRCDTAASGGQTRPPPTTQTSIRSAVSASRMSPTGFVNWHRVRPRSSVKAGSACGTSPSPTSASLPPSLCQGRIRARGALCQARALRFPSFTTI